MEEGGRLIWCAVCLRKQDEMNEEVEDASLDLEDSAGFTENTTRGTGHMFRWACTTLLCLIAYLLNIIIPHCV